ncbi:MAG: MFS family permease, partial [Francisellaceae bacterium]
KFGANMLALGAISSFFYFPYIIMQIPVGIITDKFGPRKIMTFAALLCAFATLIFYFATSIETALFSRMLMGFCAAFAFVGTLRIAIDWFDYKYFPLLAGLTQAMGMFGAAVGDAPMSIMVQSIGVNGCMLAFTILFVILAFLMFILVKKSPESLVKKDSVSIKIWPAVKEVLVSKGLWLNCLYIGLLYAPTVVLAESWGIRYTGLFRGFSHTDSAFLVGMIFIGLVFGCPIFGIISSSVKLVTMMRISALFSLILIYTIIYVPNISMPMLIVIYFAYGFFNSGLIPSYSRAAHLVREKVSGISLSITNMSSVLFGSLIIPLVGVLLDGYGNVQEGNESQLGAVVYQNIFYILLGCFVICFMLTFFMKEIEVKK